jgi:ABC-type bacteriocin/lantibiotic exporter with double-glycine peptidase domain
VLSSAPTTLIMAQIFVCIEVGAYGICLILTILFSLILQLLIDRHVAKLTLRKLKYYSDRLTCNLEMLSSLKQIKSLGWEELISLKNREYRRIENRYNFKSFIYNSLYTFIVNFAPPLSIFLIFVIDIAISGQSKF